MISQDSEGSDPAAVLLGARRAYFEAGNAVIDRHGVRVVCNRTAPNVYDANHVWVDGRAEAAELIAALDQLQPWAHHQQVRVCPGAPPALAAQLAVAGFELSSEIDLLLPDGVGVAEGSAPEGLVIRPVAEDADRASLVALTRADHVEAAVGDGREPWSADVTAQMVAVRLRKAPALRFVLASVDGRDVAFFSSFVPPGSAPGDVALVEDLFTLPAWRGRGVARALIRHCVADARARGAGPVGIGAVPGDWPKGWYASLGFAPTLTRLTYDRDPLT